MRDVEIWKPLGAPNTTALPSSLPGRAEDLSCSRFGRTHAMVVEVLRMPVKRKLGDAGGPFQDRCLSEGLLCLQYQLSGGGKEILVCPLTLKREETSWNSQG